MRLTPYGKREIGIGFVLLGATAAGLWVAGEAVFDPLRWLAALPVIVFLWILYFFRDPERVPPEGATLLLSPADGVVTHIDEVDEPSFVGGKALRISVFMSIFSVHVNRVPCSGRVRYLHYRKGQFVNALSSDSSHLNEANDMGIETEFPLMPRVMVRQIAGLIARRIVCDPKMDDVVTRGERFGMIKFSSRVEVFLPVESRLDLQVKPGDAVAAGTSVLGVLPV